MGLENWWIGIDDEIINKRNIHSNIQKKKKNNKTYIIRRSQLTQIFCPAGNPPVFGAAGLSIGAVTCFVADAGTWAGVSTCWCWFCGWFTWCGAGAE